MDPSVDEMSQTIHQLLLNHGGTMRPADLQRAVYDHHQSLRHFGAAVIRVAKPVYSHYGSLYELKANPQECA